MSIPILVPILALVFGVALIFLVPMYYKRLAVQMNLRYELSVLISQRAEHIKNEHDLTPEQKQFFRFILQSSRSPRFLRGFLFWTLFSGKSLSERNSNDKELTIMSQLGIKENGRLFKDSVALIVLCALHASTYNFFLGSPFRKLLFGDILQSPHPERAAADRADIVHNPSFSPFFKGSGAVGLQAA